MPVDVVLNQLGGESNTISSIIAGFISRWFIFMILPTKLSEARARHQQVSAEIVTNYKSRAPLATDQVTPSQLAEAIEQFFTVAMRLDREQGETGAILNDDVSQIGDYGLQLLTDLSNWAQQLALDNARHEIALVSLGAADWIMRHQGEIRAPELVVDALADLANTTQDRETLKQLEQFMTATLQALTAFIQQDLEKTNPGRPWRVLHVNRAIVATRIHDADIMTRVFDEFVQALPEEAPRFFAEGMVQMDKLDYPQHVRGIMEKYYNSWCGRIMH